MIGYRLKKSKVVLLVTQTVLVFVSDQQAIPKVKNRIRLIFTLLNPPALLLSKETRTGLLYQFMTGIQSPILMPTAQRIKYGMQW